MRPEIPMSDRTPNAVPMTTAALERHALLRERGLPTLSVLVGPPECVARRWRRWAAGRGLAVATHPSAEPGVFVPQCVAELAGRVDLRGRAVEALARRCGREPADVRSELAAKTLHGLEQLLRAAP